MGIVLTLLVGLLVGVLAKFFMPGRDRGGIFVTALLGVAGAFVAGWVGGAAGLYQQGAAGPGLIASVLGAMLILLVYRVVATRGHPLKN